MFRATFFTWRGYTVARFRPTLRAILDEICETYDGRLLDQWLSLRFDWLNTEVCITDLHEMLLMVEFNRQNLSQILIEPITFWQVTLQNSGTPNFLNFVFVFVHIAGIYILFSFTNENGELTILATKQRLLASYTTRLVSWQPIMDITKFADTVYIHSGKGSSEFLFSSWTSLIHFLYSCLSLCYLTLFIEEKLELALRVGLALKEQKSW